MAVDLSVHTMVIHCRLSKGEALQICQLYKKNLAKNIEISCDEIKCAGINKIVMNGYYKQADEKYPNGLYQYETYITINVGRLIRKTNNRMLVMDKANSNMVCSKLEDFFSNKLFLRDKHCFVDKWHLSRLDCGIDIELSTDNESVLGAFIKALHDSFDVTNSRDIQYEQWIGWNAPEVRYQSIRLCSAKNNTPPYKYSIYYKLQQLIKQAEESSKALSQKEIDEVKNVIRIEKQIFNVSKLLGTSKLSVLLDEDVKEKTMDKIIKEIKLFFGEGDYLDYDSAVKKIYDSPYSLDIQNQMGAMYAAVRDYGLPSFYGLCISDANVRGLDVNDTLNYWKSVQQKIEKLGISVASSSIDVPLKGINNVLDEVRINCRKPRKKGAYGKMMTDNATGRLRCNISRHMMDGKTARKSFRQRKNETVKDFEHRLFMEIGQLINDNYMGTNDRETRLAICANGYDELANFSTIVGSKAVQDEIKVMMSKLQRKQEELHFE